MNPRQNRPHSSRVPTWTILIPLVGLLAALTWRLDHGTRPTEQGQRDAVALQKSGQTVSPQGPLPAVVSTNNPLSNAVVSAPTPSSSASNVVSPAVGDGKDLGSIRQWAHNELEVQRMLDENDRIYRRQLVVLKQTVAAVVERNRLTGESIQQLTLPGLDGQEITFEVSNAEVAPSGLRGMFYGHVAGRPDSMVTLAFLKNRQAYTIISPADDLYLDVEPHDPGDVIVKSIDLEKYGAGLCGNL